MDSTLSGEQTKNWNTGLNRRDKEELALFRLLQPLLRDCLKLNHDLNNALTGVMGYAELLQLDANHLSAEQRENVDQIIECAERLRQRMEHLCVTKSRLAGELDLAALLEEWKETPSD